MIVELVRQFFFEAAHRNPRGGAAQCRLHGHSYRAEIVVTGHVQSEYGWLLDYADIRAAFQPIHDQIDHAFLNDVEGLCDARLSAVRARIIERLAPHLHCLKDVRLSIVGDCAFKPTKLPADPARDLPRRVRFTFEAAQRLPQLPKTHHCHGLHGHSYRIEVGARDLSALAPDLHAMYARLDHACLNDIQELTGATSELLCEWIWRRLSEQGHELTVVVVQETETSRCIYYGA